MNAEQIQKRYEELNNIVQENFDKEQSNNIRLLFQHFEDRIIEAPASGRPNYHNCFPGGWLDHTLRVIESSLKMKEHFISLGVDVTADDGDIILAAMFHDLGKLGDLNEPYYRVQTDDWRRKKLNEFYTHNNDMENLSVTDRALWLLQHFNIKISTEVWKAIKMSDGMFDAGNENYYRTSSDSRNILHYIVHFGDCSATVAEKQHYIQNNLEKQEKIEETKKEFNKKNLSVDDMKNEFDKLFAN